MSGLRDAVTMLVIIRGLRSSEVSGLKDVMTLHVVMSGGLKRCEVSGLRDAVTVLVADHARKLKKRRSERALHTLPCVEGASDQPGACANTG